MTETVLVVAKAPAGGRSKTRLVPPLTPGDAAALHEALLLDTLDACRREVGDVRILSTGVTLGQAEPEEGEGLTVVRMPIGGAFEVARRGGFAEGQTALTILLAAERLPQEPRGNQP